MKRKYLFLLLFVISLILISLHAFTNKVYAYDENLGSSQSVVNQALYVNEEVEIDSTLANEVYVNDELILNNTILSTSGYYKVVYRTINPKIDEEEDEIIDSISEYYIVNIDLKDNEVYYEEKEIELPEIEGVSYYLNDEEAIGLIQCDKEGHNELKVCALDESKEYHFDIFRFENKEELEGKSFTELQEVLYTPDTSASVYLNGSLFDGNITNCGNYYFEVKNSEGVVIGELSFVIDETIIINGTKYSAKNSIVTLKSPINVSTFAKIEYTLEPLTKTISHNINLYNGYTTYNPGRNSLLFSGIGNYILELEFNITPVTNIIDNHSYNKEVLPIVSGGSVKINGYDYNLGSTINTSGEYEMVISGLESDNVLKYHFNVIEEELNINSDSFNQAIIPAKTNNYMLINDNPYLSGEVVNDVNSYEFKIYYPTYKANDNLDNPYNNDNYIKSKYYGVKTYNFSINSGVNIIDGMEYYDQVSVLFSGSTNATLSFNGVDTIIESGYLVNKVGNYQLNFGGDTISFSVTPNLIVENNQVYIDKALILESYDFLNNDNVHFELTAETGKLESNLNIYNDSEIINKSLSSGTYSLKITTDEGYEKIVNFIVISSTAISRGASYNNGKSFDINMYGVSVKLNSPQTENRIRTTEGYSGESILTVGKHYFIFEYQLNGVISLNDDLDTAIYFYILPVVTIDDEVTTSLNSAKDLDAKLTFKDGNGIDIENDYFKCLVLDNKSNQEQIKNINSYYYFDEIGYHTITLKLDGYNYNIKLTIDSYFYKDSISADNIVSSSKNETYLTTNNIFKNEVTFVNKESILGFKLDNTTDINGIKITEVGNHKLILTGTNGYSKTLIFVIEESVLLNNELVDTKLEYEDYSFDNAITLNIVGDGSYKLDNESYTNNTLIDKIGNHMLVISGTNSYSKIYRFRITERLVVSHNNIQSNTFDSKYYDAFNFSINYDKAKITLNGTLLDSSIVDIETIGNYTLKITGTNDYIKTYTFKALPTLSFISPETNETEFKENYKSKVTPTLDNSLGLSYLSVTLNNESYSFETLNKIGKYELVLNGVGGYKNTFTFNINESLLYSFDNINYSSLSKAITPEGENLGKAIYIKKEYNDILYINTKLNTKILSESELNDYLIIDTLGNNKLVINNVTYTIKLREINDDLELSINNAKNNKLDIKNNINFNDELKYDILVDNELYDNNPVTAFGLHKVMVKGIDYNNTYYFYIKLDTNIIDNNDYYNNVNITSNASDINVYAGSNKVLGILNLVGSYKVEFLDLYQDKEIININLKAELKANGSDLANINTSDIININYLEGSNRYKEIYLNNNIFDFNNINTIGNNILTLVDINNIETDYSLTINSNKYIKSTIYSNINQAEANKFSDYNLVVSDDYIASVALDNILTTTDFYNNYYGLHKVSVVGVNGYSSDYYFSILLSTNVENKIYDLELNMICNANYNVDGKNMETIDRIGNHVMTIYRGNIDEYIEEEIEFTIRETISGFETTNSSSVKPIINGKYNSVTLSGVPNYHVGDRIKYAGNYTLTIYGDNSYQSSYDFSLIPVIEFIGYDKDSLENTSEVYINHCDLEFDLLLNGVAFDINYPINRVGNNIIRIIGNSYSVSYTITLNEVTNLSGSSYKESDSFIPEVTNLFADKLYLDGELFDGKTVTQFGEHIFKVEGVNGYQKEYIFNIELNSNVNDNDEFIGSKELTSNSKIYINGVENNRLSQVGYNIVEFVGSNNKKVEYTVLIKENDIADNMSYKGNHLIHLENISGIIIDDNEITAESGVIKESISLVGNHTFNILGLNGYESKEYKFTIIESIPLLEASNTFTDEVLISVENVERLELNGSEISNDTTLTLIGDYELVVIGKNGYSNKYNFKVINSMNGITDGGIYIGKAKAVFPHTVMLLDGEEYNSGDDIFEVGYHTLVVKGNDSLVSYEFTIIPDLSSNEIINSYDKNNVTINEAKAFYVSPDSKLKLYLNGEEYFSEIIDKAGNYEITLLGANNYSKTYTFTLEPAYGEIKSEYNDIFTPVISDNIEFKMLLNGEEYYPSQAISNVGSYKLEVIGVNYMRVFEFRLTEKLEYSTNNTDYYLLPGVITLNDVVRIKNDNQLGYRVKLNGKDSALGRINTLGNNILTIIGEGDYSKDYNILLTERVNFTDDQLFDEIDKFKPEITNMLVGKIIIDETDNHILSGFGKHVIKVEGINYSSEYTLNVSLSSNINNNDIYIGFKDISINSKFEIDGEEYNNSTFAIVGNHKMLIIGYGGVTKALEFQIKESVIGLENNKTYDSFIIPTILNASLYLDGEEYISGTKISKVGNHTLEVRGTHNYKNTYTFTILNREFKDNQILDSHINIYIPDSTLYLDGVEIENNSTICEVGNHRLVVIGSNGYEREYSFTILNKEFKDNQSVIGSLLISIPYARLYVDGVEIENETTIDEIGYHKLKVAGANNYEKEYNFTITPDAQIIQKVTANGFAATIQVNNKCKKIDIDNTTYTEGEYSNVGNHKLTISGSNGYTYDEEFTIEALTSVVDSAKYSDKVTISTLNADEMILDGKEMTKDMVISNGTHTLVIRGSNGYEKVINFTYDNPYYIYAIIYSVVLVLVFITTYIVIYAKERGKN